MSATIFDIETTAIDNFRTLEGLKKIHCIVIREGERVESYYGDDIRKGLERLRLADTLVGHNIQAFDIPAIQKLYPKWKPEGLVRDTVILSRLLWSNQKDSDFKQISKGFPKNLVGSHSLKAWGHRLGEYKGEYEGGFDNFSDEMLEYCIQDTKVTQALWDAIMVKCNSAESVILEHSFAEIINEQIQNGFAFDIQKAASLYGEWSEERDILKKKLVDTFPPTIEEMKTPAYWLVNHGPDDYEKYPTKSAAKKAGFKDSEIEKGPNKTKTIPFNPDSRQQISKCLIDKYGWKPKAFTPNGQPQVDESILKALPYDEAKMLVDYLTLTKRIGQLAEGKEAWMKLETEGRIHGSVNTNGTVTGRCTHSRPNVAQVPAVYAKHGKECRELFCASEGKLLVGCDASGLELRCLGHYLSTFDNGEYIDIILNGDIHTANQQAAGLETRDQAKTFIYGWLYGAGAPKIGSIIGGGAREGQILMKRFLKKMPALKYLKDSIENALGDRDYLVGLDGRHLPIRSKHSALNALLQSAGSILMKQATISAYNSFCSKGLNVKQVAHIHDEIQYEAESGEADLVGQLAVGAIQRAGKPFGFRCPLDGEYKIGKNWAETH
jgi:DNA polymerase I-like protein with 3'-5' exonuclease and polymerase domains